MYRKSTLIILCTFLLGIFIGIISDSSISTSPNNFASRNTLEIHTPSKNICLSYGASALVINHKNFITLNPFKVYTAQASIQPGCVLRSNNWVILENKNLINSEQLKSCKKQMNSFGYTGELNTNPEIDCIYESNSKFNSFLKN